MIRHDFTIDVSPAVSSEVSKGEPQWLGARLVAPDKVDATRPTPVFVCVHGGTFDKRYFDMHVPGREGYSQAEHFAARGAVVVALDYLGISDSSRPPGIATARRHVFAAAQDHAARHVFARLAAGELHPGLPPLPRLTKIGVGHSMGTMLTVTQQAAHATYERVALIGYSVRGVALHRATMPPPPPEGPSDPWERLMAIRRGLRAEYYLPDTPQDVIEADEAAAVMPPGLIGGEAQTARTVLADAAKITVPVFFALGEVDICPAPHDEPGAFTGSNEITFHIAPGTAHAQNLGAGRAALWDRMLRWAAV